MPTQAFGEYVGLYGFYQEVVRDQYPDRSQNNVLADIFALTAKKNHVLLTFRK